MIHLGPLICSPIIVVMLWTVTGCGEVLSHPDAQETGLDAERDGEGDERRGRDVSDATEPSDVAPDCPPRPAPATGQASRVEPYDGPLLLTINQLPASMNGSEALYADQVETPSVIHRVNRQNFTLDLYVPYDEGVANWDDVELRCDCPLTTRSGQTVAADALLSIERLEPGLNAGHRQLRVGPDNPLADGLMVRCQATQSGGRGARSSEVVFESASLAPHLDPFLTPDLWLVTTSRDIWRLDVSPQSDGSYALVSTYVPAGNGQSDFDEAFLAMGLLSETNTVTNARVKDWLIAEIRGWVNTILGLDPEGKMTSEGVPLSLLFEGDDGAPLASAWDGTFSMIALGGDGEAEDQLIGTVGRALIDPNNQGHEDNTEVGLGVFTSGVVRQILSQPFGVLLLEPILPDLGVPVGDHEEDARLLSEDFVPTDCDDDLLLERYTLIELAVSYGALALASTLAHEVGHSLGLVPPGPPPEGLFGGVHGLLFTDNDLDDAHIDSAGLNVMQTGAVTNWLEALSDSPRFNPLNWAYLRRQLVVGEPSPLRP